MRLINKDHGVFESAGFMVGIGLFFFSYHVRELLVCWLFFSVPFALLALLLLGVVVACNAGQHLVHWTGARIEVEPLVVLAVDEVQLETPRTIP